MRSKGWRMEPARHGLAAKGIETRGLAARVQMAKIDPVVAKMRKVASRTLAEYEDEAVPTIVNDRYIASVLFTDFFKSYYSRGVISVADEKGMISAAKKSGVFSKREIQELSDAVNDNVKERSPGIWLPNHFSTETELGRRKIDWICDWFDHHVDRIAWAKRRSSILSRLKQKKEIRDPIAERMLKKTKSQIASMNSPDDFFKFARDRDWDYLAMQDSLIEIYGETSKIPIDVLRKLENLR
jgi:hypothetical protein